MNTGEEPRDEPKSVPIDPEAEQRELGTAGWERIERQGKIFWRNPESGHRYPQGVAITLLRRGVDADFSEGQEGSA